MLRLAKVLVLLVIGLIYATAAMAGPQCAPGDQVAEALKQQFGETLQASGVLELGGLVALYANPRTGTWTITKSAAGITCLIAAGDHYQAAKPGEPT